MHETRDVFESGPGLVTLLLLAALAVADRVIGKLMRICQNEKCPARAGEGGTK